MDIAHRRLQGVVHGRMHQLDDRAGVFADGLERQVRGPVRARASSVATGQQAVHGMQRFLVPGQIRRYVGAMRQAPAEAGGDALLGPCLQVGVEGIARDQHQRIVLVTQRPGTRVPAPRRTAAHRRPGPCGAVPPWPAGVMQRRRQRLHKTLRVETGLLLQHVDHGASRLQGRAARSVYLLRRKPGTGSDINRLCHVHCMLPARSKIGKYINTTMPPMTSPMNTISSGSNSLVKRSTQRAVSSS